MKRSLAIVLVVAATVSARPRTGPAELSIAVNGSFERVLGVVRTVCSDGTLHGTSEYESESGIGGAVAASSSNAFPDWAGPGQALYKTRGQTIAPAHFVGSNDRGTATVQYIVEPVTAGQTRIRIAAVFVEDGRHRKHPSDGLIEAAEFDQIARELKQLDHQEQVQRAEAEHRRLELERQHQAAESARLRREMDSERARLAAASAAVAELERRLQALRGQVLARVKVQAAELKQFPYVAAPSIQPAAKGELVTVLQRTPYWTRVRLASGKQGWVYSLLLEALDGPAPAPAPPSAPVLRSDLR